ncbi:MAG: FmdB family zinc ribbon protein [Planctomycetota bacterium]|jgi:putative FmdB family regulatory protein
MPLYEYACRGCGHRFEELVRGSEQPACPHCKGADLEKLLSTFAVSGPSATTGDGWPAAGAPPCGSCGDPRGPGACGLD